VVLFVDEQMIEAGVPVCFFVCHQRCLATATDPFSSLFSQGIFFVVSIVNYDPWGFSINPATDLAFSHDRQYGSWKNGEC